MKKTELCVDSHYTVSCRFNDRVHVLCVGPFPYILSLYQNAIPLI